jgi:acetyl esterase/lipase
MSGRLQPVAARGIPVPREENSARVIRNIPYVQPAEAIDGGRQSLDLYLPNANRPPLVIFVPGEFWTSPEGDDRTGSSLVEALVPNGVAVALVRYRRAPHHQHPSQAQDVAAALAHLISQASRYGFDSKRIFLAGHSAGAHLASLVALDPKYLAVHGLSAKSVVGIIAFSGIYDLTAQPYRTQEWLKSIQQAFGGNAAGLKSASPLSYVRADAPRFLIFSAAGDINGFPIDAHRFAQALRAAGHRTVDQWMIADRDHFSIRDLAGADNQVRAIMFAFLKVRRLPPALAELTEAKRNWARVGASTEPFWQYKDLIRAYPIDGRFVARLLPIYGPLRYELLQWPLENYYAIDLFAFLDAAPSTQGGQGDYLVTTNLRGEKQFWKRQQIEAYKPVIVVGIDDEKNLFRFVTFYRMQQQYSWRPGPQPPVMARPLGGFIHFLKEPPPELQPQQWHYALTTDGFRRVDHDPLDALTDLPRPVYEALTFRNGCVYCHSFRGVGTRSHHILSSSGAPHGGFALTLESYPPEVWKAFMFSQEAVADKMGTTPNVVDESARETLYGMVRDIHKTAPKAKK